MEPNADICSMQVLLTAATSFEIKPTLDYLEKNDMGEGNRLNTLVTGAGMLSCCFHLASQVLAHKPDLIIQAGVAGSFGTCQPGEVLVVDKDTIGDQGAWESDHFRSLFDLNLADKNGHPYVDGFLQNPHADLLARAELPLVSAITVNEISTEIKRIEWLRKNLSPELESMEGAALHYVCLQLNIPFLQLRSVSNRVGERDKGKWKMPEAITNLNEQLILLVKKLMSSS